MTYLCAHGSTYFEPITAMPLASYLRLLDARAWVHRQGTHCDCSDGTLRVVPGHA